MSKAGEDSNEPIAMKIARAFNNGVDAGKAHERKRILEACNKYKSGAAGSGDYNQGLIDGQRGLFECISKIINEAE